MEELIKADNVSIYIGDKLIVKDIDFFINKGEMVTIIGPNGGGKTSLIRSLLNLLPHQRGQILRREGMSIGYVPQFFHIDKTMPMTVRFFLSMGGDNKGVVLAHKGVLLADELSKVELSSNLLDKQLSLLSGGELRRVLLCRALLSSPDLLVLDEPTQCFDLAGQGAFYKLIARINSCRRHSVILVSHDLHFVMSATDRVLCIDQRIRCQGTVKEVSSHPEYFRLFTKETVDAYAFYQHHHHQ